jgi:putative pyruvate formate lyase activating enzyme
MTENFTPAYLPLLESGELAARAAQAREHLKYCDLCANCCHVNRLLGTKGAVCRTGERAMVYSYGPHHGEERPLSGRRGSGTIFFSWCNLRCVFCQNWDISQRGEGREVSTEELARMMLQLQQMGCHNVNLVSPSHLVAQLISALAIAAEKGLRLPVVYNTGGYDSPEGLALLDGLIDIYMPDMKFADSTVAGKYTGVKDYAEVNRAAVKEMHRQVGDLVLDEAGIARRGLLIRHLLLPENLAGTDRILAFIAGEISPNTYLNLMDQYRSCYRADQYPPLDRRPTRAEFSSALALARELGLRRLDRP